jgi:AraC family transcriptional regulator
MMMTRSVLRTIETGPEFRGTIGIEAELASPSIQVQIAHYQFAEPPESTYRIDGKCRVELCLSSRHRSARACFRDQWNSHRFEPMGELFVLPPFATMSLRSDEAAPLSSVICELSLDPVFEIFDSSLPELTDQHLMTSLNMRDATVRSLLLRLADEVRHPGFASQILVESIATQLKIEMLRLRAIISESQVRGGLAPWQLRAIDDRLKEVRAAPSLTELATLCRISVRQLTRGFGASRGTSIGAYVSDSQMSHAKRLLATDESVTAIAEQLGFSSSSNFCYAFRRALGKTPKQFRQTLLRQ